MFSISQKWVTGKPAGPSPLRNKSAESPHELRYLSGPENALVQAAARVVQGEKPAWNPLLLHGVTGTGKTLLLQLFVAQFQAAFPQAHVVVTTGADFARAYAHACDTDSLAELRQRYSRGQLLALDDLQHLAGKPAAQRELLHLLDGFLRRGALVLMTARHAPRETTKLDSALLSRLEGGLVVPLVPPHAEARCEIINLLAAEQQVDLPPAIVQRLAGTLGADISPRSSRPLLALPCATVPQLRHVVVELAERARLTARPNHAQLLDELLARDGADHKTMIKQVAALVGRHYEQSVADLRGPTRRQAVVQARSLAMYLSRRLTGASYGEIGRYFGNRDHTTVLYACSKVADLLAESPAQQQLADHLQSQLAAADVRQ